MRRLVGAFAGRTYQIVGNLIPRLNCIFTTVPLKEIDVNVQIQGFVAEVTSSLLYSNEEDSPVEASFTFPVDDGSAVYRFEAEIEGRHIVAEIQDKEQVRRHTL